MVWQSRDSGGSLAWHMTDFTSKSTSSFPTALAYDLWGERMARLDADGSVWAYDLRTSNAPVQIAPGLPGGVVDGTIRRGRRSRRLGPRAVRSGNAGSRGSRAQHRHDGPRRDAGRALRAPGPVHGLCRRPRLQRQRKLLASSREPDLRRRHPGRHHTSARRGREPPGLHHHGRTACPPGSPGVRRRSTTPGIYARQDRGQLVVVLPQSARHDVGSPDEVRTRDPDADGTLVALMRCGTSLYGTTTVDWAARIPSR